MSVWHFLVTCGIIIGSILPASTTEPRHLTHGPTMIDVCLAGATGWAGSELARAMAGTADLALVAAVARTQAGHVLGEVLGDPRLTAHVYASAGEALATPCDVFVEYTKPDSARTNILAVLDL